MHHASRRLGRISFVLLAGICSVALVGCVFLFSKQSPRSAAAAFLSALAKSDPDRLADLSIVQTKNRDEIRKEWSETLDLSKTYVFYWELGPSRQDGKQATVRVDITRKPNSPQAFPEHYELLLVETNDGWKVDVPQIARDMYPYLPQ
jgi:hypothetical protein